MSICPEPFSSSAVRETGGMEAVSTCAVSAISIPKCSASSPMVGSCPRSAVRRSFSRRALRAFSFIALPTFTVPPSRKIRRISPRITGTA